MELSPGLAQQGSLIPSEDVLTFAGETYTTETVAKYSKWKDIEIESLNSLIGRQMAVGTNVMVARVLLKKGARVPLHSHHNEQVTYILEGALHFYIDNRELTVSAGEVLCIPPNMPHEAIALEDTVDLDIFNPPRQDWIDKDDAYLRQEAKT
jgi:quercetin dioxygenase-like cupin family protein